MRNKTDVQIKRCIYCGRFFKPDYRVKVKQKSCQSLECRTKRKKESQRRWVKANPGYFKGRYENTQAWRKGHPDYQRQWRAKRREIQDEIPATTPMKSIRLVIPVKYFKGEIQDEIHLVRQCGCGYFVTRQGDARYKTRLRL
jgi:hypothetical protein